MDGKDPLVRHDETREAMSEDGVYLEDFVRLVEVRLRRILEDHHSGRHLAANCHEPVVELAELLEGLPVALQKIEEFRRRYLISKQAVIKFTAGLIA